MANDVKKKGLLLLVEDEEFIQTSLIEYLRDVDITIITANDGVEGLEMIRKHNPDAVCTDYRMPNMDGKQLLINARAEGFHTPFLYITGYMDHEFTEWCAEQEIALSSVFNKPLDQEKVAQLKNRVRQLTKAGLALKESVTEAEDRAERSKLSDGERERMKDGLTASRFIQKIGFKKKKS